MTLKEVKYFKLRTKKIYKYVSLIWNASFASDGQIKVFFYVAEYK